MSDSAPSNPSPVAKFRNAQGITAIKDGQKRRASAEPQVFEPKPSWLRVKAPGGSRFEAVKRNVGEHRLSTVCQESHCPNMGECWSNGTATIMLMGSVCTRACRFCAVDTGNPNGWLDQEEPQNTAKSVELMALRYIVLTSVDRDDLDDGGASHYAACVRAIRSAPHVVVEALTPDFDGDLQAIERVVDSGLEVFAQNVETVKRLTHEVRDPAPATEDPERPGARQAPPPVGTDQDQPDARPGRDRRGSHRGHGRPARHRRRHPDPRPVPATDPQPPQGPALGQPRGVQPLPRHRPGEGLHGVAAGPLVRSSYRADRVFENNLGLAAPVPVPGQQDTSLIPALNLG